jgi:hypothetical protein
MLSLGRRRHGKQNELLFDSITLLNTPKNLFSGPVVRELSKLVKFVRSKLKNHCQHKSLFVIWTLITSENSCCSLMSSKIEH